MAAGEQDETARVRRPSSKKTAKKTVKKTATRAGSVRTGSGERESEAPRAGHRVSAPRAMRYAAEQLKELLGRAPESVSAVKPTEDGWQADVEVLELERVPGTTSVMATYRVMLDKEGELVAYERTRRYTRGQIDRR
ncbi:gas vesicle protein [Streptomyces sp. SID8375]|uniref:gas vesicle protein GvpO n=1 Tax=unclassified Streptomyces TaxID=2593676 RepID=UPI000361FB7F|nr:MULTISPECIES: gas vesicle protein [unclassified Streptomyces]MCW7988707.1 gas vesicle protein [Streptomyces platensis subsp. clarensis]MYX08493.1 gas vesicle protein [Streptomyces sp. SID8375]